MSPGYYRFCVTFPSATLVTSELRPFFILLFNLFFYYFYSWASRQGNQPVPILSDLRIWSSWSTTTTILGRTWCEDLWFCGISIEGHLTWSLLQVVKPLKIIVQTRWSLSVVASMTGRDYCGGILLPLRLFVVSILGINKFHAHTCSHKTLSCSVFK